MPSLVIVVLALQITIYLINTLGAQAITDLLWNLYSKAPTPHSTTIRSQTELRREVVRLKREMGATSSQDEFAKWAKLRRQHDKALARYDETSSSLTAFKATFTRTVNTLRWLGTTGTRFFLQWWFTKRPMFWLPRGWVPGYVEWVLAFPRAPTGSVSIQVWGIACNTVVQLIGAGVVAGWVLFAEQREKDRKEKSKMGMRAKAGQEKKEL
ncbi:protein GET1 [Physcia stellaris]|nr:protein GET1 [Physcia stellaris]